MSQKSITDIKTIPFRGGCKTSVDKKLLKFGEYSMVQNIRQLHPGMEARKGCIALHSTADSTNRVMSIYQFVKGKTTERHLYAQMSDSDVLEATSNPPTVTAGAFGSEVFSGAASPTPASWANNNDLLLFANGVDTAQIYPGTTRSVEKFIVYKGAAAIPIVPEIGDDYTIEVTDNDSTTYAVLDSLGDLAVDFDCIFVMTEVPITTLNFTVKSANGTASTSGCNYWNGSAWTAVADFADGTASDSKVLAQSGAMTWTLPTAHVSHYMFGVCGFWYQIYLATGDLDSETEVSEVTYTSSWQAIDNVWDGVPIAVVEAQFYDSSTGKYSTYGSSTIDLGGAESSGDLLYVACTDPTCAFWVDVGTTPAKCQDIATIKYWNGSSWATASNVSDQTDGLSKSGWITFARQTDCQKYRLNGSVEAFWYQITIPQQTAVVCLNFDGSDGATTFTDLSGKTWTAAGDAQLDTAQKKYGTASLLCDGTGDYIYTPAHEDFDFGTGDFTIEWFARVADNSDDQYVLSCRVNNDNQFYIMLSLTVGVATITIDNFVAGVQDINTSVSVGTMNVDTWYHIAFERKNGSIHAWLDGVPGGSSSASASIYYDGATRYQVQGWSSSYGKGWIDDLRISKTAVYTPGINFTPPASAVGLAVAGSIPSNTSIGMDSQPYYDVSDFGKMQTVCSYKNRAIYSTSKDQYMYVSALNAPQVLNGDDSTILSPGDGRANRPVSQVVYKDSLIVFQEEKGKDGGCITKYTIGSSISDIDKTIVSNILGTMNANTVVMAEGIKSVLNRDQQVQTMIFFLSRTGFYITDTNVCYAVDQDIRNYFDTSKSECIRRGYEDKMWVCYDSSKNVIRLGLVSGASATLPNLFPVLDLEDMTWSFDVFGHEISCMTEVEAESGDNIVLQVGGGVDDGTVYLMNYGNLDVSNSIDSYVTMELDGQGDVIRVGEFVLRFRDDAGYGGVTVTPYEDDVPMTAITITT